MAEDDWLERTSPAFRLMIASSWLAPESWKINQEKAIRDAGAARPDWAEYLSLVVRHRTPAISWAALNRVPGFVIPGSAALELVKRNRACRVQAIRHCRLLASLLKAFNDAGISVMTMKGPILSSELYGDVGLRHSSDLDIAVAPEDIPRAQKCLNKLGWQLDPTLSAMTPRQWERLKQIGDDLLFIHHQRGSELELHIRNFWESPEQSNARWAGSILSVWQGSPYWAMNSIDKVIFLCGHGGAHSWFRAKWLGDLARIHTQEQVDWEAALEHAQSIGQEKPMLACLHLLKIVYKLPLPCLQRNPWKKLPRYLITRPLHALEVPKEPDVLGAFGSFPDLLYRIRYERSFQPQKTWGGSLSELLYCRQDFKTLRLPDSLFWAYAPLRPVLFGWRKLKQILAR